MTPKNTNDAQDIPQPLQGKTATIASLSRRERDPEAGQKRRKMVATALGAAGGVGSVLLVKSAATATALWVGAPALVVAGAGLAAVMAATGTVGYFRQRSALKAAGKDVPPFSGKDLFKSMFTSKAALVAGGMTALAAALPGALMLVAGSSVAALGAGLHEYKSRRAEMRARGIEVGRPGIGDAFRTIFQSKSAGRAFLISAGIGTVLSLATGAFFADAPAPAAHDAVPNTHDAGLSEDTNPAAAPAPQAQPPMPEMVERPAIVETPSPVPVESAPAESTPVETAPAEDAPVEATSADTAPVDVATTNSAPEALPTTAEKTPAAPVTAPVQAAPATAPVVAPVVAPAAPTDVIFENTGPDGVHQKVYGSGLIETIYPAEASTDIAASPAVAPAAPTDVIFENTGPDGVHQKVYGSGIVETIYPAEASADAPADAPVAAEKPSAPVKAAPVQTAAPAHVAPVVAPGAAGDVIFENTGADGVRQKVYGSGLVETIYPAEASANAPADTPATAEKPAAPVKAVPMPSTPVQSAPVHAAPAPIVSDTTNAQGVRTILHASGIRETITPVYADAVQAPAASADVKLPAAGECLISETDTEVKIDCKINARAAIQPGSGVDFRAAAHPQAVFHAGVSADSAAINAGEFLENHAVPAAQTAYEKGFFRPR